MATNIYILWVFAFRSIIFLQIARTDIDLHVWVISLGFGDSLYIFEVFGRGGYGNYYCIHRLGMVIDSFKALTILYYHRYNYSNNKLFGNYFG